METTKVRIRKSTFSKIRAVAELEHRSVAKQVDHVLVRYLADWERKHGPLPARLPNGS